MLLPSLNKVVTYLLTYLLYQRIWFGHISYFSLQLLLFQTKLFQNIISATKLFVNPTGLRKAKTVYNFGLSECNRVKE